YSRELFTIDRAGAGPVARLLSLYRISNSRTHAERQSRGETLWSGGGTRAGAGGRIHADFFLRFSCEEVSVALNIKHPEADRLARTLARATGESITEAVLTAIKERLQRETGRGDREAVR